MSEVVAINYPAFNTRVKTNKRQVIKQLEKKVEEGKLDMLKASLREKSITFNDEITDYYQFIDSLQSLTGTDLIIANKLVNNINREVDRMILSLKDGSTSAFTKFLQTVNDKVLSPVGNVVTNSLAMNTVLSLIPSIPVKMGVSILLTGMSLANIYKVDKYKMVTNRTYELDKVLQELETTIDKDGNIIDTRFSENDQTIIRSFLKTNNVIYEDTGYLSLREAVYSLSVEQKEELCRKLDMNKEQEERIEKLNDNLFTRIRKKVITPIAIATTGGVGLATSINSIDPTLLAAPLNGTLVGTIVSKLTESKVIGWVSGAITGCLNFVGKFIPAISSLVNKISAIENVAVLAVAGAGVGLLGVIGKGIYNAIKNRKNIFNTQKLQKKLADKDQELYGEKDIEEISRMREILKERSHKEETFIISIVCQYMNEIGIEYEKVPDNLQELQELINGLSNKEKRQIRKLFESLEEFLHREPNKFKRCMKKAGKFIKTVVTLGLAGMSVTNILTSGGFFAMIKEKLFGVEPVVKPEYLSFDDSKGRAAYESEYGGVITEVVEKPTANPEPQPGPAPVTLTPTPTPTPTPGPSVNMTPETPVPTPKPKYVCGRLPKLNYNLQDVCLGTTNVDLSALPDDELLSLIVNSPDYRYTAHILEVMDKDTFLRFKTLIENSPKINRNGCLSYQWVKDCLNARINTENQVIKKAIDAYNAKVNLDDITNKVGTGIGIAEAITEEEKQVKTR